MLAELVTADGVGCGDARVDVSCDERIRVLWIVSLVEGARQFRLFHEAVGNSQASGRGRPIARFEAHIGLVRRGLRTAIEP